MQANLSFKKFLILSFVSFVLFLQYLNSSLAIKQTSKKSIDVSNSTSTRASVMTYNLENLFDTEDDPLKADETFLPLSTKKRNPNISSKCHSLKSKDWKSQCLNLDWSPRVLKSKMKRLADVILNSYNEVGPDLIIFQEVENFQVLEEFRTHFLNPHYKHPAVLLEGPDERGIDVAILSKWPLKSDPKLHILKFSPKGKFNFNKPPQTRGILEATFLLPDQTPITVFGVQFPSQGTPSPARQQALEQLKKLMDKRGKTNLVMAGGDFNITSFEEKNHQYFKNLGKDYMISHLVGCENCRGTNYFHPRRSWSFLDALVFSKNFNNPNSPWQLDTKSIRVYNQSLYQNNKWGSPKKFNYHSQQGVSDHWPMVAEFFLNSSRSKGTLK